LSSRRDVLSFGKMVICRGRCASRLLAATRVSRILERRKRAGLV